MVKAITGLEGNEWSAKSSMYHNHDTSPCKSHKFCHRKDAILFSRSYCAFLNSLDRILMVLNFVFSKKPAILGQLIKTVTLERSLRQTKPNSTNSRQNLDICHLIRNEKFSSLTYLFQSSQKWPTEHNFSVFFVSLFVWENKTINTQPR